MEKDPIAEYYEREYPTDADRVITALKPLYWGVGILIGLGVLFLLR